LVFSITMIQTLLSWGTPSTVLQRPEAVSQLKPGLQVLAQPPPEVVEPLELVEPPVVLPEELVLPPVVLLPDELTELALPEVELAEVVLPLELETPVELLAPLELVLEWEPVVLPVVFPAAECVPVLEAPWVAVPLVPEVEVVELVLEQATTEAARIAAVAACLRVIMEAPGEALRAARV
jgi:hypothetical protein